MEKRRIEKLWRKWEEFDYLKSKEEESEKWEFSNQYPLRRLVKKSPFYKPDAHCSLLTLDSTGFRFFFFFNFFFCNVKL